MFTPAQSKVRCPETGLSVSYAYKKGCRCDECRANKALYTSRDTNATERTRIWHSNNPERVRQLKKEHADRSWLIRFSNLLEQQKGLCAICGEGPGGMSYGNRLCVDHDHETGEIRGLLCGSCNIGLGHFKDNPLLLKSAIKYLKNGST